MSPPERHDYWVRFEVPARSAGTRLDRVLQAVAPGFSRNFWAEAARRGVIRVDGAAVRPSKQVPPGSTVDFHLADLGTPELLLDPSELGPPVYDDGEVVVFAKPAGMLTHPTGRVVLRSATVLAELSLGVPVFPVHRLDKYTSGLLLMARSAEVAAELGAKLKDRQVEKTYLALTATPPAEDRFTVDLALDQTGEEHVKLKMLPCPGGKPAVTECAVLERHPAGALVECRPLTGRQHQIRAHMLAVGAPLVGDLLYGPGEDFRHFDDLDERKHATPDGLWHGLHARQVVVPEWRGGALRVEVPEFGPFAECLARWRAGERL